MSIWFKNGSVYQVIGADDPDRLVGANPVGIIFSEWSVMPPKVWEFLRPIVAENGGWVVFIYTPRGRNHGYRTLKMAEKTSGWFSQRLSVEDTEAIPMSAIEEEREAGMPEELVQQEFYCSFDAPLVGSYYGDLMSAMMEEERIGVIPHEPEQPVTTAWDLGVADATAIWFHQQVGHEHRLIDYYQSSGVGLDHYAKVLSEKPYTYREHLVPHDATVRELGSGKSRIEVARKLGMNMRVAPKMGLADGINAVRMLLQKSGWTKSDARMGLRECASTRKSAWMKRARMARRPSATSRFTTGPPTPRMQCALWRSACVDSARNTRFSTPNWRSSRSSHVAHGNHQNQ
jgi:hypothetical protein